MRIRVATLAAVAVSAALAALAACTERSTFAIAGVREQTSFTDAGAVRLRVVDDPAGAVPITGAGARPAVTLVFRLSAVGSSAIDLTDGSEVAVQVVLGSANAGVLFTRDNLPGGRFSAVRLTLTGATLAIPGTAPGGSQVIDLLGGAPEMAITRPVTLVLGANLTRTLTIDLNSARWLHPVADPPAGEPAYRFDGTAAFLSALTILSH